MKHLISTKSIAAAAIALGALTAASSTHPASDVHFIIGVAVPGIHAQLTPVHMQHRPVFTPEHGHFSRFNDGRRDDGDHWHRGNPYGDHDCNGIVSNYCSGDTRNRWHQPRLYGPYGDLDRDGIKNRDRDGDGEVCSRFDRRPDNPRRW